MPIPTTMADLSTVAANNSPAGSDVVTTSTGPDEYFRALSAILRREQAQGASVASAATVDLGAISDGSYVHITGAATISSFGTAAAGIERTIIFDGALTLVHGAETLILPSGANITTEAGDAAIVRSEGGGKWRCVSYMRASGAPINADALLTSPAFTGTPTAPTPAAGDNSTRVATTAFVNTALISPAFAGTPTAPTPAAGDNSTRLATTAFVNTAISTAPGTKPVVSYMSKSGHNSQAILVDGVIYQANGTTGYYSATTGVYNNGANTKYGVMNGWNEIRYESSSPVKKIGGFMHAYAFILTEAGELFTFGQNTNGQCGLGHTAITINPTIAATGVLDVFTHPSQGEYNVTDSRLFILKSDGLYASGYNAGGQLGVGDTANKSSFTKCTGLPNSSSSDIKRVFPVGSTSGATFVLTSDGKIWAAGTNNTGWLGTGNTTNQNSFVDVTNAWAGVASGVLDIKVVGGSRYYDTGDNGSKGTATMLITLSTGKILRSCGHNEWGSLGDGTTTARSTPVKPLNVPEADVIDIAGFGGSPLTVQALCTNGDLWAWGYNGAGAVGDGTTTNRNTPTIVQNGVTGLFSDGMVSLVYGYYAQSFIKKADGLYMCGFNDGAYYAGKGVTNTANNLTYSKVLLPNDDNVVVDMGHFTTHNAGRILLALTAKGNIYVWGYNGQNGIHTDNTNNVPVPQPIAIPRRFKWFILE